MLHEEHNSGEPATTRNAPRAVQEKGSITEKSSSSDSPQKSAWDDTLSVNGVRPSNPTSGNSQTGKEAEGKSVTSLSTHDTKVTMQYLDNSGNTLLPDTVDVLTERCDSPKSTETSRGTIVSSEGKADLHWDRPRDASHPVRSAPLSSSTASASGRVVSEWSHQQLAPQKDTGEKKDEKDDEWQDMPAFAPYNLYDDEGKLIAHEKGDSGDEMNPYANLGGAAKGYTRVQVDEDAQSATSMDDNTAYLFKGSSQQLDEDEDEQRDPLAQMRATKNLLTDNQRIAYVGVVRLAMADMAKELRALGRSKSFRKEADLAIEAMRMWSQKMMVRLYGHMELDAAGIKHSCALRGGSTLKIPRANHDRAIAGPRSPA